MSEFNYFKSRRVKHKIVLPKYFEMISKLYLVDWESNGQTFFHDVTLSAEVKPFIQIYIFYQSRELPPTLLSDFRSLHTPKRCVLVSPFSEVEWKTLARGLVWRDRHSTIQEETDVCIISRQPLKQFGEIIGIFQRTDVKYRMIDTEECSLLDEFEHKCLTCRTVHKTKQSLKRHDKTSCLYLAGCKKFNADEKSEKSPHKGHKQNDGRGQSTSRKCEACSKNCVETYCAHAQDLSRKHEMKQVHKSQYVGKTHSCWTNHDSNEYTAHFLYSYEVLPCLAVSGCPHTFRTMQEQAHHHVTQHGCRKPYFCNVCYKLLMFICFETDSELLFHGKLEGHCEPDFAFVT